MRILLHPLLQCLLWISVIVYAYGWFNAPQPWWIRFYLNDLLCMPIVLSICLAVIRYLKSEGNYFLDGYKVMFMVVFYAIIFEWILPKSNERYTSDIWDIVCYAFGGFLFYVFQRKVYV